MKLCRIAFSIALSFLGLTLGNASALASGQQQISGFRFQSCDGTRCVEVVAAKAWLSQLGFGFSTAGSSKVLLRSSDGRMEQEFEGTDASLHTELQLISLETIEGGTLFVSLEDGSIRFVNSPVANGFARKGGTK